MTQPLATPPLRPLGEYRAYLFDVDGTLIYPRGDRGRRRGAGRPDGARR